MTNINFCDLIVVWLVDKMVRLMNIEAFCELCQWRGCLGEALDRDEDEPEYCPSCQSPYVAYSRQTLVIDLSGEEYGNMGGN